VGAANEYAERFIRDVLKAQTDRDKQIHIGASNMSQLCDRCLGDDMVGIRHEPSRYWGGAVVGTAIHQYVEYRLLNEEAVQSMYPEVRTEHRMVLGEIEGYGTVKSTSDLYLPDVMAVGDIKTTTQKKLDLIIQAVQLPQSESESKSVTDARYKLATYVNQLMLYGRGYEDQGFEVKNVSLLFVCRDMLTDDHIYAYTREYSREWADRVWNRAVRMWEFLQSHDVDELDSHDLCWYCSNCR
jgi:hypothetical protein